MDLNKNVYVMNNCTYDIWCEFIFEMADKQENRLDFFGKVAQIEIVTDDKLSDGVIEVFDKNTFELLKDVENET